MTRCTPVLLFLVHHTLSFSFHQVVSRIDGSFGELNGETVSEVTAQWLSLQPLMQRWREMDRLQEKQLLADDWLLPHRICLNTSRWIKLHLFTSIWAAETGEPSISPPQRYFIFNHSVLFFLSFHAPSQHRVKVYIVGPKTENEST